VEHLPITPRTIDRALTGDRAAARLLVDRLSGVVQARVARALLRQQRLASGRNIQQEVEDLTQQIFEVLFADGARVLRGWDPERGLSLPNFVGLVAEREVSSILRSGRRSPWTDDPTLDEDLVEAGGSTAPHDAQVASQEILEELLDALRARLSPLGLALFERLMVQEASVEEVCAELKMSADAVYAWRSRLGKLVRELHERLVSDSARAPRRPRKSP